ncbi:hypothetical protein ACFY7C_19200 [Streptomyces sp. NPDC012769]|uniref:hypothetical protein n=1 Tax=Streptomyces sp. NPDC012769 TaxID=3364848 RepID=UPI0036AA96CF
MAKRIQTLWLPGDRDTVLEHELRQALRREKRFTAQEFHVLSLVHACRAAKGSYPWWRCTRRSPCVFCQEIADV